MITSEAEAALLLADKEARDEAKRQLLMAYGRFANSEDGRLIIGDLMKRYGWSTEGIERPCFQPGMQPEDAIHRDGMKEPVRHILAMSNLGIVLKTQNPNEV